MGRRRYLVVALVMAVGGLALLTLESMALRQELAEPLAVEQSAYAGSAVCRKCHHDNDASWHRTYHRTMTQDATEATVLGDFSGRELRYMGVTARMQRAPDGAFEMAFSVPSTGARWDATVVRTVGSHRYQQYLARDQDILYRLPVAWDVEEQRFIHMNGAFLTPDPQRPGPGIPIDNGDYNRHVTRWNDNCIYCHNVAPKAGITEDDAGDAHFDSEVAELGVACEACHGPGSTHVERNGNPLRRYLLHLSEGRDPTIANPLRLPPARAADVCGRCHGQRITKDISKVHAHGDPFVPGQDLGRHSRPLFRDTTLNGKPGTFTTRFWPDGTARLTAYEFQGLLQSACALAGSLTCNDCHSMHRGDPAGQLKPELTGNQLCTQCHTTLVNPSALYDHTRHHSAGEGSTCVNCHMPETVYGLVRVHRSHRIGRPETAAPIASTGPNPCLLCHTDRTRKWARERTKRLWPNPAPPSPRTVRTTWPVIAAADDGSTRDLTTGQLLLAGDPIERAVAARALGSPGADAAGVPAPARAGLLLASMQHDDYPAVRQVAWRSLRTLIGRHLASDTRNAPPTAHQYTATDEPRARAAAVARLRRRLPASLAPAAPPLDRDQMAALRALSDTARIEIGE